MKKDNIIITVCDAEYSREKDPVFNVNLRIIGTEFYKQIHTNNKFGCPSPMLHKVRSALLSQLFSDVKKVIFNNPTTIVFWSDGTKTVVKCQEGDVFDQEKGLALCFMKKIYGNAGYFNNVLKKYVTEEKDDDAFIKFTNGFAKLTESLSNLASSMSLFGTGINDSKVKIPEVKKCKPINKNKSTDCICIHLLDNNWESFKVLLDFIDVEYKAHGINKDNYLNINLYNYITNCNKECILDLLLNEFYPCYIIKYTNPIRYAYVFEELFENLFEIVEDDIKGE